MKRSIFFLMLFSALITGCSGNKANRQEASVDLTDLDETPIEEVEDDLIVPLDSEVLAEDASEPEELIVEETEEQSGVYDNQDRFTEDEEEDFVASSEMTVEDTPVDESLVAEAQEVTKVIEKSEYEIQKNDTLMLISWKIYGDYSKWRELKELNESKVHGNNIWTGEKLTFNRPVVEFEWAPEGSPYLIQKGDTLGDISKSVYDEAKHWQAIWYNNRDLIRNPDLIFAGFTIYYQELDQINQREIASKMRLFKKEK